MGFTDLLSDMWDALSTHPSADAEAPTGGASSQGTPTSGTDEESGEEKEVNEADAKKDDGEGEQGHMPGQDDGEGGEAPEEEDEEIVDPKGTLEEECAGSKQCAPTKHHYDECQKRVTGQIEDGGKAKEDCVEEFFHLAHCASSCAAPELWKQLK